MAERRLPGIGGEPRLVLAHPCCRHCDHPVHPQFTGHPGPCWACEVAALMARVGEGPAMADRMSEADEVTFHVLRIIAGTTVAELRRVALADYAARARQDPGVAVTVSYLLAARAAYRGEDPAKVVHLADRTRSGRR